MLEQLGLSSGQDPAQEVHPERDQHTYAGVVIHTGTECVEELRLLSITGESSHLLELVDHEKHTLEPAVA